jgi:hypothetical protein
MSAGAQTRSDANAPTQNVRILSLHRVTYHFRAGEAVALEAPADTIEFLLKAKSRRVALAGPQGNGIVVGPDIHRDGIAVAASLLARPGEYSVNLTAGSYAGEQATTSFTVVLAPMATVPTGASRPPVILLNGYQLPNSLQEVIAGDTCPMSLTSPPSKGTFGSLESSLLDSDGVPAVYFFDNCVEGANRPIEELGATLEQVLNSIFYDSGEPVPQVDLVAHSMGGLIVRSYLAGLQAGGALTPPSNPGVRKCLLAVWGG